MFKAPARPSGQKSDYLITNRRKNEDARKIMLETTAYFAKTELQSQFEESTNLAIRRKKIEHRLQELRDQESIKLKQRQAKLQALFEKDNQNYRDALIAQESTTDSRVDAMRTRVAELKGKREAERKKIVEQKMLQKWRAECDELRRANSLILGKEVAASRASQLLEKSVQQAEALKERQHYDILWEQDRQKKIQREEKDRANRHELNQHMIKMLGEQMAMLKAQAAEEAQLKQEEARLMRQDYESRGLEEERERHRRHQEQRLVQLELDAVNLARLKKKQKEAKNSLELDLKIINEYIAQDEMEKKAKTAKREALRREMQMYRDHLMEQKLVEKQREKEIEQLYRIEDEKLWATRSEKWKKEQKARDRLMKEVMVGRQEQLKRAVEQNRHAQEQIRIEKERLEAEFNIMKEEEEKKWEAHQESAKKYCDDLFDQIQKSHQKKLDEKRRVELEDEAHRQLSASYDHILAQEMAKLK